MQHRLNLPVPGIDLQATLIDSAQCFHWHEVDGGYCTVMRAGGDSAAAFRLAQADDAVIIASDAPVSADFWRWYFDLQRDYAALESQFGWHEAMAGALRAAQGLRVLRQPAWETVLSFILSANNNVGRIRTLVAALSKAYGTPAETPWGVMYAIPTAQQLHRATEPVLRALGVGYRAPYLVDTAARVAGGFDLDALRSVSYPEAHAALMQLKGVGDKVADCICLFGLQHSCAFPVDVWVERLLTAWFGMTGSRKSMAKQAMALLGSDAGIIQQFLFHCARLGLLGELR